MADHIIKAYTTGVHNLIDPENIPKDASQDSLNWYTQDGSIRLINGKALVGTEGTQGAVQGEHFGYKANGATVHWRKIGTKIQYFDGTTWQDTITGLTATYEYVFTNYASLAGNFTFAIGLDGIYKMNNANPGSYISLYDATKNYKFTGALVDKGRMIGWGRLQDKTGLYLSKIDTQKVGTGYTTVTNENIGSGNGVATTFTGTLAFKAGGAARNAFGIVINDSPVVETFTDNFDGTLTGSGGGTGTINYITGAFSVTFAVAPLNAANNIKASYTWENANVSGITDFTFSATRVAGEGDIIRQDEGGDPILTVKVGIDGAYYSLKQQSVYRLELDAADTTADNNVFRREIGIEYFRAATNTQNGIVFMNTANKARPELTILQQNPLGGNVEPFILFPHFDFSQFLYDGCVLGTFGQYIVMSCRTPDSLVVNRLMLMDKAQNKVDITTYGSATLAKDSSYLYGGSPYTQTVYKLFDGVDDDNTLILNQWTGKDEDYNAETLKKYRRLRLKGLIDPSQWYEVYVSYDASNFSLVGTVRGDGPYVDYQDPQTIGANMVGEAIIGGGLGSIAYPYFMEIKTKVPKFRKRTIKFVAGGYGYVSVDTQIDRDILVFENRIPKRYREKQNVALDGETDDLPNPEF